MHFLPLIILPLLNLCPLLFCLWFSLIVHCLYINGARAGGQKTGFCLKHQLEFQMLMGTERKKDPQSLEEEQGTVETAQRSAEGSRGLGHWR